MSAVFGSSALFVVAFEERGAEVAGRRLSDGIVSAVNTSEVITRFVHPGASGEEARTSLLAFGLEIRPFDTALAVAASLLRVTTREKGLPLGDRACIALAMREQVGIITADRAWATLDLDVEVELIR